MIMHVYVVKKLVGIWFSRLDLMHSGLCVIFSFSEGDNLNA
jgi:hypothetical protein